MAGYDRAQLPAPLAFNQSEFSWYIFEGVAGGRRLAGLVSIHRTGPRARSVRFSPHLIMGADLPRGLRELVPSWLPIVSPIRAETDDRPIFSVALYDLDARTPPLHLEREIEHADFDPEQFSATTAAGTLSLRADAEGGATIDVQTREATLALRITPRKPQVVFGDGSPTLRHGKIVTSYVQRPRLAVTGSVSLGGESSVDFTGEGVHDHQWLTVTAPNLKWIWPHLRLPDGRELTGYVIRDSTRGRSAEADDGEELARAGWIIEEDATVRRLRDFDVHAIAHVDTPRGRVPTKFVVEARELALRFEIEHVIAAPYLRMAAFGDVLDAGIYEGPIDVTAHPAIRGWIEVMNAAHVRLDRSDQ
ncbi:MAG TPA: lipocalin-like domain-containing protein [Kofleriaceae bacterium]